MRNSAALVALALAVLAAPVGAQVYKWVDENGRTHYGEKPPEGVKATEVGVAPPPSGASLPQPDWKQKELEAQRLRVERERKERAETQQAKQRDAVLSAECTRARQALARLEEQIPVYQRDSKGERVYLEDKDRPAAIAHEKHIVAENCGR